MDKQTLSHYGWIIVMILCLSVMLALATPLGNYIGDGVVSIANGFVGASNKSVDKDNLQNFDNEWNYKLNNDELNHKVFVNDEATYVDSSTNQTLNGGDLFPNSSDINDRYIYGDYEYRYGYRICVEHENWSDECGCLTTCDGWSVVCINPVAKPGIILESINNKPVVDMTYTFAKYVSDVVEQAPDIPKTVTYMGGTFKYCTKLKTYVGSTDADGDFSNYVIPKSAIQINSAFYNCKKMIYPPKIPDNVVNINWTFQKCTSLKIAPVIPNSVTNMNGTFIECKSLIEAPQIPEGVKHLSLAFYECENLIVAPIIPKSAKDIANMFNECTSLTGTITINCNPTNYTKCLYNTKITSIIGETTMADDIIKTKTTTIENPKA